MADYGADAGGYKSTSGRDYVPPITTSILLRRIESLERVVARLEGSAAPQRYRVTVTRTSTYTTKASSETEAISWYYNTGHTMVADRLGPNDVRAELMTDDDLL